jgi:hypothetical protein
MSKFGENKFYDDMLKGYWRKTLIKLILLNSAMFRYEAAKERFSLGFVRKPQASGEGGSFSSVEVGCRFASSGLGQHLERSWT